VEVCLARKVRENQRAEKKEFLPRLALNNSHCHRAGYATGTPNAVSKRNRLRETLQPLI
jgi:hypothetical protein